MLRDALEAARPVPPIQQMREKARQASQEPHPQPVVARAATVQVGGNTNVQEILNFIGQATGINILYDRDVPATQVTRGPIELDGVTLEQALNLS